MHFGSLPSNYEPGLSYLNASASSRPAVETGLSRRSILALVPLALGFSGGVAAGFGFLQVSARGDRSDRAAYPTESDSERSNSKRIDAEVRPGTVEWALWIRRAPAPEFLKAAGELERVRMRSRGDERLTAVFVHLLETALGCDEPTADPAGAIAVRCLHRLGADHHLEILGDRVLARDDRPITAAELSRVFRRSRGGRRR